MATLGELRKKLAKLKKEGASTQTKGRVQYQINQLLKKTGENSGKVIRSGNGSIIKSSSGAAVRQKANKAKPKPKPKAKSKTTGPSKRPNVGKNKAKTSSSTGPSTRPNVGKNKVKTYAAPHAKITKVPYGSTGTGTSKLDLNRNMDFSNIPRIKGILPPAAQRTHREQIEAFRRKYKLN